MKTKAILLSVMALLMTGFMSSCDDSDGDSSVETTGISIDMTSLTVEIGAVGTLVATLEPTGATGDITWSSSDATVAAVNNGIVTGISVGTTTIAAVNGAFSTTCEVEVTPKTIDPGDLSESLSGSNYFLIQIDEISAASIESKISQDFRPDEINKFFHIWSSGETFAAGTTSGLNFYNQAEGWLSLSVTNEGWSGAGYTITDGFGEIDMTDLHANPEDYVFHVAFKALHTESYLLIFGDGTSEAKVCIGAANYVDKEVTYVPYTDFARDNEWHGIEIPVTELNRLGLFYNETCTTGTTVFSFLAGGISGTTFEMDAAFFYKKAQ